MTRREKLVVSAFTGTIMTSIDDFVAFVAETLDEPPTEVMIREGAMMLDDCDVQIELQKKLRQEYFDLCVKETPDREDCVVDVDVNSLVDHLLSYSTRDGIKLLLPLVEEYMEHPDNFSAFLSALKETFEEHE